jgi:ribosomal-protein-alanine N-acetyltransferase
VTFCIMPIIERLQMQIHPENLASKRVAEKCGFKLEGTARGALFHRGKNCDAEVYSLLRTEVTV